jgi:hypothetical protein
MFLTGHKRPPFKNEAGYSRKNIYKRRKRDKNSRGFMDNRRRAMDKPMDSELPTGLSTALLEAGYPQAPQLRRRLARLNATMEFARFNATKGGADVFLDRPIPFYAVRPRLWRY